MLIPHPHLHAPRTGYALAKDTVNHVGEPIVMVVAENRYLAEDAAARIRVDYECCPPWSGSRPPGPRNMPCTQDIPDNIAAHLVQQVGDVDAGMAAAPHRLEFDLTIDRSCSMPLEGKARLRPVGPGRPQPAGVLLHPGGDLGPRRDRRQTRSAAAQGRGDRAGCRRRLRGQDHAPVAGGDPGADGRDAAGPAGEMDRGPPGALHLLRPRARPGTAHRGRIRRRPEGFSRSTSRSGTTTAPTRPTASSARSSPPPNCSARTNRVPTGWNSSPSTPQR